MTGNEPAFNTVISKISDSGDINCVFTFLSDAYEILQFLIKGFLKKIRQTVFKQLSVGISHFIYAISILKEISVKTRSSFCGRVFVSYA